MISAESERGEEREPNCDERREKAEEEGREEN